MISSISQANTALQTNIDTTIIQPVYQMIVDFIKTGAKGEALFDTTSKERREELIYGSFANLEGARFLLLHASEQEGTLMPIIQDAKTTKIYDDETRTQRICGLIERTKLSEIPIENMAIQHIIGVLKNLPISMREALVEPARTFLAQLEVSHFREFADTCRKLWIYNTERWRPNVTENYEAKARELAQVVKTLELPDINPFIEKLMKDVKAKLFPL